MKEIKLKSCPFCGTQLQNNPPSSFWFHPQNSCLLSLRGIAGKEQFAMWNTRKPIERIVDQLEEFQIDYEYEENAGFIDMCIDIVKKEGLEL